MVLICLTIWTNSHTAQRLKLMSKSGANFPAPFASSIPLSEALQTPAFGCSTLNPPLPDKIVGLESAGSHVLSIPSN